MFGAFAQRFDAWLLAEGVETTGEFGTLRQICVPLAQGYLLGRPAPGWSDLSAEARDHLRTLARARTGDTLRLLVETGAPLRHAADAVARDGRLRIDVDTPLAEAAHRALNRDTAHRWDPVLCIDDQGRFVGVVRMERLVEQLAVGTMTPS